MVESDKTVAERRSDEAFADGPFQDPRGALRDRLRGLREAQPAAFRTALEYFEKQLIPNIAAGADPVAEWVNYGRKLGELAGRGKTYTIDAAGRALALGAEFGADALILHLPDDLNTPALPIAVPRQLSAAQQATLDLLINRARALAG